MNQIFLAIQKREMHPSRNSDDAFIPRPGVAVLANASETGALSSTSSLAQLQQYSRVIPNTHIEFPLHERTWSTTVVAGDFVTRSAF